MTQRELATASGVAESTISALELERRGAYPKTMRRIANSLGLNIEGLLE